MSQIKLTGTVV